ncbi:hypothetical protein PAXRUDRAFT_169022, partial [Paxillus rubicundulus Ve08.2h10]
YDATLAVLMQVVWFWPPVPSMHMAAHKWNMVGVLDFIAKENSWCRPSTTQVMDSGPIPNGTVLKRSHSDCGEFVFLPPEAIKGDGREAEKEREYRQGLRNWEVLCESTHTEDETWVSQQYVDTLETLGEWRCFLVGGHIMNVVHTSKGMGGLWVGKRTSRFLSLQEIR